MTYTNYEEIENRRGELEALAHVSGYTVAINAELAELYEAEMALRMDGAYAIAKSDDVVIFIESMYECGYAIHTKINGEWDYDDGFTAVNAMTKFAELARKHGVKTCLVRPKWLDRKHLEEIDEEDERYADEEAYYDACLASSYGDDSLLDRYNRSHGIEKEYGPSNPWDAPGMSVRDFI